MPELRPDLPLLPDRFKALPINDAGYPVPWFVGWVDEGGNPVPRGEGRPEFRVSATDAVPEAWRGKRCWLCGGRTGRYVAYVVGPMCTVNRISSEPPSHRECAEFAAKACPFLARPGAKRRPLDGVDNDGMPGIPILRNPGVAVVWVTERKRCLVRQAENGVLFHLGDPTEVLWLRAGRAATREEAGQSITAGIPELERQIEPEEKLALEVNLDRARHFLPAKELVSGG